MISENLQILFLMQRLQFVSRILMLFLDFSELWDSTAYFSIGDPTYSSRLDKLIQPISLFFMNKHKDFLFTQLSITHFNFSALLIDLLMKPFTLNFNDYALNRCVNLLEMIFRLSVLQRDMYNLQLFWKRISDILQYKCKWVCRWFSDEILSQIQIQYFTFVNDCEFSFFDL